MGYQTHYVDINLIMAIWRNSYSLARIFNKRSCFLWTCLARLLVQKSSVQKKRPCLSTNQIEKVCWLVFSGQRKKYVQQTNTYRKDTRLIWIYLIWIFLNFFIYHKAFTGFNILFRKCQVGSEYSIWWKVINTMYISSTLTYLFQIQAHNFVRSWIWKIQPVFLIPTPVPEQIKSSFMGQPTYILQLCTYYVLCCIAFGCWLSKSSYRKKLGSKFVQLVCMRENFDLLCCRRRIYFVELSASCCPNQTPKKGF